MNAPSCEVVRCINHYASTTFVVKERWRKTDETDALSPFWVDIVGQGRHPQETEQD